MLCTHCGQENPEQANVCFVCGSALPVGTIAVPAPLSRVTPEVRANRLEPPQVESPHTPTAAISLERRKATAKRCPSCGLPSRETAERCGCGYRFASGKNLNRSTGVLAQPSSPTAAFPLFPVATRKFIILSVCSFGIYELYWCYQNWKRIKNSSGESFSPFWRAVFAPFWVFSLFRRIRGIADSQGMPIDWSAEFLAAFYVALSFMWRLPDPWGWISFASFVPLIPVQQAAQRLNERHAGSTTETRNNGYSAANVALIVIGGLFLVLVVVGMFVQEMNIDV